MLKLNILQRNLGKLIADNSAAILTGVGVAGVVGTAVMGVRAGLKTGELAHQDYKSECEGVKYATSSDMTKMEKVKAVWPLYVPVVAVGSMSIVCIIMSNRISAQRAAAMAAAYGISQDRFKEYKDKVEQRIGLKKADEIRVEANQEGIDKNPPNREVLVIGSGDVLFKDLLTGRYFRSSVGAIQRAENQINEELLDNKYAALTDFYHMIGLEGTPFSDEVGWNQLTNGLIEVKFDTNKTPDDEPCMTLEFAKSPVTDYQNHY